MLWFNKLPDFLSGWFQKYLLMQCNSNIVLICICQTISSIPIRCFRSFNLAMHPRKPFPHILNHQPSCFFQSRRQTAWRAALWWEQSGGKSLGRTSQSQTSSQTEFSACCCDKAAHILQPSLAGAVWSYSCTSLQVYEPECRSLNDAAISKKGQRACRRESTSKKRGLLLQETPLTLRIILRCSFFQPAGCWWKENESSLLFKLL